MLEECCRRRNKRVCLVKIRDPACRSLILELSSASVTDPALNPPPSFPFSSSSFSPPTLFAIFRSKISISTKLEIFWVIYFKM